MKNRNYWEHLETKWHGKVTMVQLKWQIWSCQHGLSETVMSIFHYFIILFIILFYYSLLFDILQTQRLTDNIIEIILAAQVCTRVHVRLYMVYQYFQRHVATAVRAWLVRVTCGRPLVGHSDWINSHQKHAADWVVCSCTPHKEPRMSNIASRHYENCYGLPGPGFGLAWCSTAMCGEGLWCHTPAEWWMEDQPTWIWKARTWKDSL